MEEYWQWWLYHTPEQESRFSQKDIEYRNSLRREPSYEEKLCHAYNETYGKVPDELREFMTEDVIWTKKWCTIFKNFENRF